MTRSRYTADIDLARLNDAHTLGILAVPAGSAVLDIGAADGSVARVLQQRGCHVWAVELDPAAAAEARPYCERVVVGDVQALDLEQEFAGLRFDAILCLDVLEHLAEPESALRRAAALLKPHGQVIASIPNVTHADVRLSLLRGSFEYAEKGLLDRTHLRFFDREGVESLFTAAGLTIGELLRVIVGPGETELGVDLGSFPPEVIAEATCGADADTYQFVVVSAPVAPAVHGAFPLAARLQWRVHALERQVQDGAAHVSTLMCELEAQQARLAALETALAEQQAGAVQVDSLVRELEARQARLTALEALLSERTADRESLQREWQICQRELAVKEEYIAILRDQLTQHEESIAGLQTQLSRSGSEDTLHRAKATLRRVPPVYVATRWLYRRVRSPR